ncbi:BID domain-containing T4SS effector [Bartonella tribocorum]|uniref:Transporter n=1 Tax=Bartonella tribocorum TaxID=85701 RepID=A0A2M6US68_9HYPH|nr:BID domain-containing T4SS effector [Bartonella tribocorum]PIT69019.1 transporter [Bartonella tribocorum]
MKKRNPSPLIAEMMAKFQQQDEQSPTSPSHSQASQSVPKPPVQKRSENLSYPPKVAPPPPSRVRAPVQTSAISPNAKIPSTKIQETPPLQTKMAPPPPPRIRGKTPTGGEIKKPETQESLSTRIKTAPQRPPRAKDREKNKHEAQEGEHLYAIPISQTFPRLREKAQTNTKKQNPGPQESPSTHTKSAPPQRPPRAKDREKNRQVAQESPSLQTKAAPPKPPRMRDKVQTSTKMQNAETLAQSVKPKTPQHKRLRQQSSSSSQDSETYAIPRSQKSHRMRNRKESDTIVQKPDSPQAASEQPKPSHRQKTSINKMERELLLVAYQEEIRFLCGKVYGDRLILNEKIEAIKEDPDMGEQLLWDVTEHPQSISKFAGRKVLGIKNGARKQAEETLPSLRAAINGYVYTSKYTKIEDISQERHTEQRQHQQAQQKETISQHIHNPLKSEKKIKPLSNQEITRRVQQDPSVQYSQREVQYWCQIVYGNPFILQYRMEEMQKIPEMGEELVFQIERDSTSFAPLAGKKNLGIKNGARKAAEENLSTLCTAIKDYAETIKQLREAIVQNHQTEQPQRHHQPLTDLDKKLQKQQSLSQSPKVPERSKTNRPQELAEASKQEEQPPIRPRRAAASKAMALS